MIFSGTQSSYEEIPITMHLLDGEMNFSGASRELFPNVGAP